jgi:hypothetical protein
MVGLPLGPGVGRISFDADLPEHSVHHGYIAPPLKGSSQGGSTSLLLPGGIKR